jgi:hypothetical protein
MMSAVAAITFVCMQGDACWHQVPDALFGRMQGVRAVVTLNEDFEVFISTEQYKVRATEACALCFELTLFSSPYAVTSPME